MQLHLRKITSRERKREAEELCVNAKQQWKQLSRQKGAETPNTMHCMQHIERDVHENIIIKCNKQFSLRLSPIHADIIHAIIISFHFIYICCAHTNSNYTHIALDSLAYTL